MTGRAQYCILFALVLLISGCTDASKKYSEKRSNLSLEEVDRILVGVNWFEPAENSTFARGLFMALDEINRKGLHGKKIEIDYRCNSGNPDKNYRIATSFARKTEMAAVVGHYYSNLAEISTPIYHRAGLFVLNIDAQLASLSLYGFNLQYRLAVSTEQVADYLANVMLDKHLKKPIFINSKSDYSQDLTRRFINELDDIGIRPQDIYTLYERKKPDSNLFLNILYLDFDSVFLITEPEIVLPALKIIRNLKLEQPAFSTVITETLLKANPDVYGDFYMLNSYNPCDDNALCKQFRQRYKDRYNQRPDQLAAMGYTALRLYADMIDSAKSIAPVNIAEQCAILDDYKSVIGTIKFNRNGDIENRLLYLQKAGQSHIEIKSSYESWLLRFKEGLLGLLSDSFVDEKLKVTVDNDSTIVIEIQAFDIFIEGTTSLTTRGGDILHRLSASVKGELSCFRTTLFINNLYAVNRMTTGTLTQPESHRQWALDRANTIASAFTQSGYEFEDVKISAKLVDQLPDDASRASKDIIRIALKIGDHDPVCEKVSHHQVAGVPADTVSGINP